MVHIVLLRVQWSEVAVTKAHVQGQGWFHPPVILDESTPKILAVVLAGQRGSAGGGIEGARFRPRGIVEEIPDVEETEVRPRIVRRLVQVIQTREFAAKFDGVIAGNLGGHIAVGIGPLVKYARPRRAEILQRDGPDSPDRVLRQSEGLLRV